MSPKAGLVMNTPIEIPIMVVTAKPLIIPAPAHHSGIIATNIVEKHPKTMKKALFTLSLRLND